MANVAPILLSAVKAPTGLWITILNWIESSVVNYGWVIILFTLLIKACLTPIDFVVKYSTKKTSIAQLKLAPQIERLNKKYQNNKQELQVQTNALYKREGINPFLSCIVMLVNIIITTVVFLTLFSSLRTMSAYKAINQYDQMQTAYVNTYNENKGLAQEAFINKIKETNTIYVLNGDTTTPETISDYTNIEKYASYFYSLEEPTEQAQLDERASLETYFSTRYVNEQATVSIQNLLLECGKIATDASQTAVNKTWNEVKENWLWIGNIWVADNYSSPLPTYDDLNSMADSSKQKEYKTYVKNIDKDLYSVVTASVKDQNERWNGYFILAVLTAVTSFLSQWLNDLATKSKSKKLNDMVDKNNGSGGAMKVMKFVLPIMMVVFVLTSSSAFGLYYVTNSLVSIGFGQIINLIVNAMTKKKQDEVDAYIEKETIRSMRKLNKKH